MEKKNESSSSFPIGKTAQEKEFSYVPECYKLPSSARRCLDLEAANVPVINLEGIRDNPARRSIIMEDIANACRHNGFFQVKNHGISQSVLDGAISAASGFFKLPMAEKTKFMSRDVHKPVRYCTSIRDGVDKVQLWRIFLKHYAHPLVDWIHMWPTNPPDYREKMGEYTVEVQKLAKEIMGVITKNLGLGPTYMSTKLDQGVQVIAANCYPPCPQPELTFGLPPHSDYSCLTIVLQDSCGLEIQDFEDRAWKTVPATHATLQVHVGNQLEALSNGRYKSVVHRVTLSSEKTRISIASLHSLGMDVKVGPAQELVDEEHRGRYRESSFRDFLNCISNNDIGQGKSFLDTLTIAQWI